MRKSSKNPGRKGDIKCKRIRIIKARLSDAEYEKILTMMENYGYKTISSFIRDLLFKKRLETHREVVVVSDKAMRDRLNAVIYQIKKVGNNYNQVVAAYQKQASMVKLDGTPYLNTHDVDQKMTSLMRMTQELRDEVAVAVDLYRKYTSRDGSADGDEVQNQ